MRKRIKWQTQETVRRPKGPGKPKGTRRPGGPGRSKGPTRSKRAELQGNKRAKMKRLGEVKKLGGRGRKHLRAEDLWTRGPCTGGLCTKGPACRSRDLPPGRGTCFPVEGTALVRRFCWTSPSSGWKVLAGRLWPEGSGREVLAGRFCHPRRSEGSGKQSGGMVAARRVVAIRRQDWSQGGLVAGSMPTATQIRDNSTP
jgi:hypothetical protein